MSPRDIHPTLDIPVYQPLTPGLVLTPVLPGSAAFVACPHCAYPGVLAQARLHGQAVLVLPISGEVHRCAGERR